MHTMTVISTPMKTPTMVAVIVVTNDPPDSDWSASGPVSTLSVAESVFISDLVNP
jgi:hypothetical protein